MPRRALPKFDVCKVRPERFRRMSADQLMKVWARLGASAPARRESISLVKGIVSNLAAAKTSQSAYKDDPEQRRRSVAVYMHIVRNLEAKLRAEQARGCAIRAAEAAGDWKRVVKLKKQRRR
jgi:hypothetical protein